MIIQIFENFCIWYIAIKKKENKNGLGFFYLQLSYIYGLYRFKNNNQKNNYYYDDYNELFIMFIILISSFIIYLISLFFGRHLNNKINKDDNKTKTKNNSNEIMNGF